MDINFYNNFFYEKLNQIKSENRYRVFNHLEKNNTSYPFANLVNDNNKKEIIIWCSNDYLGMSQKKSIIDAAKKSLSDYSQCCVRLKFHASMNFSCHIFCGTSHKTFDPF